MSSWAIRHPRTALAAWFAATVLLVLASIPLKGAYNDSFALPGAQSTRAQDLLTRLDPQAAATATVTVLWSPATGTADVRQRTDTLMRRIADLPHVTCVTGPYHHNYGRSCPAPTPDHLTRAMNTALADALAKETHLTTSQLNTLAAVLPRLAPIATWNGATLATTARALPGIAKLVTWLRPGMPLLDRINDRGLIDLGLTRKEAQAVTAAVRDAATLTRLPAHVTDTLAAANPAELAATAAALPADVARLDTAMKKAATAVAAIEAAVRAAEKATDPVSPDRTVAKATVALNVATLPASEAARLTTLIDQTRDATLTVGASGAGLTGTPPGQDNSVTVGLAAAILILLAAFGSLVAAGLPILTALSGLLAGQLLVGIAARFTDVATFAPTLSIMIALGVGIDYALFILNRHRQGLLDGLTPTDAATTATRTAGRAVLFAGTTVIVALLGMFVLGIQFFDGLALAAAVSVLTVMLAAVWALPAALTLLGTRTLAWRLPWARHPRPVDPATSRWSRYGQLLQKAPLLPAAASLLVIATLAAPAAGLRLGFPDAGADPAGSITRDAFDLQARGYGPGSNGPFVVAVRTRTPRDYTAVETVIKRLQQTPGVASTLPSIAMMPAVRLNTDTFSRNGHITSVLVTPSTGPQDPATAALLTTIRERTTPAGTPGAHVWVGGTQAVTADFTAVLGKALPLFLLLVVGLGFVALTMLFRSLVIPLTAAISSLLSFAAALGITVAVFSHGTAASLLGVTGTGPILPFLPVMVFAILFGLSMDYQVFLVSRMQEEHRAGGDTRQAVRYGLAGSGRVVVAAASIMTCVFASFIPSDVDAIKLFGVALASAVIVDAFLVRLVLVPAVMTLLGRANWWMPRWLDRILPHLKVE